MKSLNALSTWKTGDKVSGVYYGGSFTGVLSPETRPTPDYKNVIFVVTLDHEINVFGMLRNTVAIGSNDKSGSTSIYLG